ncbi:MAG: hypothetical protein Q8P62_04250 [Candidatus Peregrinibacteria bacterium]|nr:hypothetical protein [Candidatus Peregrinibacteria bacterium]
MKICFAVFSFLFFSSTSVFAEESVGISVTATVEGHSYSSGGGGAPVPVPVVSYVSFSGYAYPAAKVYIESDSQNVASLSAGVDGLFSYEVYGITAGVHDFSIYAQDLNGNYSQSVSFFVDVPSSAITNVSNVFVPPTISVDKAEYGIKDEIKFSGYSMPNSSVYVVVNSTDGSLKSFSKEVKSDRNGYFEYAPIANVFNYGAYLVTARTLYGGVFSSFGSSMDFQIMGRTSLFASRPRCSIKSDLNRDCKVNILDFFVELRWYKKPLNKEAKKRFDFNDDGQVDLADFSIMAFYWSR